MLGVGVGVGMGVGVSNVELSSTTGKYSGPLIASHF